jgi:hypothetical protein
MGGRRSNARFRIAMFTLFLPSDPMIVNQAVHNGQQSSCDCWGLDQWVWPRFGNWASVKTTTLLQWLHIKWQQKIGEITGLEVVQVDRSDGLNDGGPPDQGTSVQPRRRRQDTRRYLDCILVGSHLRRSKVLDNASMRLGSRASTTHPRRCPDSATDRVLG